MKMKQPYMISAIAISIVIIIVILFISSNRKMSTEEHPDSVVSVDPAHIPREVEGWPSKALNLGEVAGVSVNSALQPVIFHRADRVYDTHAFNGTAHYQHIDKGLITEATVLTLDPKTGKVLETWGRNLFLMPHGLTIDTHDNLWLTDVALHQGFKFEPGQLEPTLVFGEKYQPDHLCMPTSFAIATTGEIYLAEGYCNNRILKYNALGELLETIPSRDEFFPLLFPHGVALIETLDRICIADREGMKVVCPRAGLHSSRDRKGPPLTIQAPEMRKINDVAAKGNIIYAVSRPLFSSIPSEGLIIDSQSEKIIDRWAPRTGFVFPHAVAVCPNGSSLYVVEINPNRVWKFDLVAPERIKNT